MTQHSTTTHSFERQHHCQITKGLQCMVAQMVKQLPAIWETQFDPWVRKIPWRRKWQPTPVLLPEKFLGQRSLVGYSPWGRQESYTTEQLQCSLKGNSLSYQFCNMVVIKYVLQLEGTLGIC